VPAVLDGLSTLTSPAVLFNLLLGIPLFLAVSRAVT
jgi:hypothetical protein